MASLLTAEAVSGAASFFQALLYHRNDLHWNEIDYFLQVRQVRVEILNTIREDLQDIYEKDERSLDTYLVVTTLMLGFGFGFVVEGTFPKDDPQQHAARLLYAFVTGLSLVCPFFSLLAFLECRRRLNVFVKMFNIYFSKKIQEEHRFVGHGLASANRMVACSRQETEGLPKWYLIRCCARRRHASSGSAEAGQLLLRTASAEGDVERLRSSLRVKADYFEWWHVWVEHLYRHARLFMTLGVGFNVFCAALLLGMYFQSEYPDTPMVWRIYSGIVTLGLISAAAGFLILEYLGPEAAIRDKGASREWLEPLLPRSDSGDAAASVRQEQLAGLPPWATEGLLDTADAGMWWWARRAGGMSIGQSMRGGLQPGLASGLLGDRMPSSRIGLLDME